MSDDPTLEMDAVMPEAADSDALLVAAYVKQIELPELRRYVALDIITALNPWSKDTLKQARAVEQFLLDQGVRGAVE